MRQALMGKSPVVHPSLFPPPSLSTPLPLSTPLSLSLPVVPTCLLLTRLAQNEPCGGAWAAGIIEGIRGRVEGEPYCARRGLGSKGAPEVGGDARVRGRHGELTRMLLGLLAVGEGHGGAGLEARMKEVLESELWERCASQHDKCRKIP